ncbi:MAG: ATP-dependent sacrificial sulfur transferase LarE [Candidatus Margulisbacteria bacterium]|nr:ATP-dependent sacrificial sulfur transferase LarE [Candidatus Margulisiibacteriota bacterium]
MSSKYEKLKSRLKGLGSVLIAYSGGVDSTLLLKAASDAAKEKILAVVAQSPTYSSEELESAVSVCKGLGIEYNVIQTDEFHNKKFVSNPTDRCYYCKRELFSKLAKIAKERDIDFILDGSNYDDRMDFRPGGLAREEFGVRSPLSELKFTKQEIRDTSKMLGLPTWDKPSDACLASRVPYGTPLTPQVLKMVEEGEKYLRGMGFKQLRVRHHGTVARIEVNEESLPNLLHDEIRDDIYFKFKKLGYTYVSLDLKGYRTGSMNETHIPG